MNGLFILLFVPLFLAVGFALWDRLERRRKSRHNPDMPPLPQAEPTEREGNVPSSHEIVLIGSLSSEGQLSVCLIHGFYHIPAAIAGADFERIDYVAIYQSRRFFGAAAGVRYYARVRSARLLPRYEIREIPRQSHVMYVRFELEPWQVLPVPIAPKGKGVTSARCSFSRLLKSDNMHQLLKK